ncbi:hypothetical protein AGMMS49992_24590 [Clostridia bacterium]|nr:hypothetical protein AGMMS49992_24590 [Clostridia bacterium]
MIDYPTCKTYLSRAIAILQTIMEEDAAALEQAARTIAASLSAGGTVYSFGTGHAHLLAEEIFYRAGGLAAACPMLDERLMLHVSASGSTDWERKPGVAAEVLARYPVKPGDTVIIISQSGRNTAPVEMARLARERGAAVIALTNLAHSKSVTARNPWNLRLFEAADITLDLHGAIGDAAIAMPSGLNVAPTSTVAGAAILQALVCRVRALTEEAGQPADCYMSSNVDGGDAFNAQLIERYRSTNPHL